MKPMKSIAKSADAYVQGMANAGQAYKEGIDAFNGNPMQLAKAQIPKMLTNFTQAVNSGKVAAGFDRVSENTWRTLAKTKGAANLATGGAAARPKYIAWRNASDSAVEQLRSEINGMDKGGAANAKARSAAWIDGMIRISEQRSGQA